MTKLDNITAALIYKIEDNTSPGCHSKNCQTKELSYICFGPIRIKELCKLTNLQIEQMNEQTNVGGWAVNR